MAAIPAVVPTPPSQKLGVLRGAADAVDLSRVSGTVLPRSPRPPWLEEDEYDIDAVISTRVTRAQFLLMFQNLLASRFHLVLHRASREGTVHVLEPRKGRDEDAAE